MFSKCPIGTVPFYAALVQAALPTCEFVTRYDFALAIGSHSRRRYRYVKLELRTVPQFISPLHELKYTSVPSFGRGESVAEAVALLAPAHRVATVEIRGFLSRCLPDQIPIIRALIQRI